MCILYYCDQIFLVSMNECFPILSKGNSGNIIMRQPTFLYCELLKMQVETHSCQYCQRSPNMWYLQQLTAPKGVSHLSSWAILALSLGRSFCQILISSLVFKRSYNRKIINFLFLQLVKLESIFIIRVLHCKYFTNGHVLIKPVSICALTTQPLILI